MGGEINTTTEKGEKIKEVKKRGVRDEGNTRYVLREKEGRPFRNSSRLPHMFSLNV